MIQSIPSLGRTVAAWSLYAAGGIAAFGWKVLRQQEAFETGSVPHWLVGTFPNLLPALVMPALIFIRPQIVRFTEYLMLAMAILFGLIVYEIVQLWMPSRTFDYADIVASVVGAGLGCLLCWLIFFCWLGNRSEIEVDPLN